MKTKAATVLLGAIVAGVVVALAASYWPWNLSSNAGLVTEAGLQSVVVVVPGKPVASPEARIRLCGASPQCRNGENGVIIVTLLSGQMPDRPVRAVVQTDTNCNPDAYGISHCTNQIRLSDGRMLVVRHDHNMRDYPCLIPDQVVELRGETSA